MQKNRQKIKINISKQTAEKCKQTTEKCKRTAKYVHKQLKI